MKRKKRKLKTKKLVFNSKEIDKLARIGGKILTKQAIANHIETSMKSFYCPLCRKKYCYNTDGKQIYCGDTCHLEKCEKTEYIPKTCNHCKGES